MSFNALDGIHDEIKREFENNNKLYQSDLKNIEFMKRFISHKFREYKNESSFTATKKIGSTEISYVRDRYNKPTDKLEIYYKDIYKGYVTAKSTCTDVIGFWIFMGKSIGRSDYAYVKGYYFGNVWKSIENDILSEVIVENKNKASLAVSGFYRKATQNDTHLPKDINETIVGYFNIPEFR